MSSSLRFTTLGCVPAFLAFTASCATPPAPIASPPPIASAATTAVVAPLPIAGASPPPDAVDPDVPSDEDAKRDAELTADAARIVDVFVNGRPKLTPDGKKVVFRSNRDGIPQLYVGDVAKPEAAPTRLVTTKQRIGDALIGPDGASVLFLSDVGADENWSIFKVGIDGAGLTELTKGETLRRDAPRLPAAVKNTMFYSARANAEKSTRVYRQSLDGAAPTLVYTDPAPAYLTDVSNDGKRGLLIRRLSLSDTKVVLVDLTAGTARTIYPAEGSSAHARHTIFSTDGALVYVSTDGGAEQALVLALDTKTLTEKARYLEKKPATATIEELVVGRTGGDKLALLVDAGNRYELRLLDAKTLKPGPTISTPLGAGGAIDMSDDGRRLAVAWSTPQSPTDVYAIDTQTGKVKPLRNEPRPTLAKLPPLAASIEEVTSFDGTKVPVNLYLPGATAKGTKLPTIVMVHGGPADSSHIGWSSWNRYYASHGFSIVVPNVRGSTGFGRKYEQADDGAKRLDAVRDLEEIGKWAQKQPWADAGRLVVFGGSYGGYMTLMGLTRQPTLWKAGVDFSGIYSWKSFLKTTSGVIHEVFEKEIGAESDPAFLDSISPESQVDAVVAPLFVYAGQNDPRVPRSESDAIVKSLRARKVPVEYMVAADEGHSLDRKETVTAFLARTLRFLDAKLKIESATPK